jgi:hypothetical protein
MNVELLVEYKSAVETEVLRENQPQFIRSLFCLSICVFPLIVYAFEAYVISYCRFPPPPLIL